MPVEHPQPTPNNRICIAHSGLVKAIENIEHSQQQIWKELQRLNVTVAHALNSRMPAWAVFALTGSCTLCGILITAWARRAIGGTN